jgi:hypothetical protein
MAGIANKGAWALAAVLGLLLIAAAAQVARGGPLDPPGPVGPSMKTLDEVEPRTPISSLPYTIAQPGSYYLTQSLTGVAGQNGITITAADVSLDLRGFTLAGVPGALDGIRLSGRGASIANGVIRDWDDGIDATSGIEARYERLTVRDNAVFGIRADAYSLITDCIAFSNGIGISSAGNTSISHCVSSLNSQAGFYLAAPSITLSDCNAVANFYGVFAQGSDAIISRCTFAQNLSDGIYVSGAGVIVEDCVARENDGVQINVPANGTTVRGCTVQSSPGDGIYMTGTDNWIHGNTLSGLGQEAIEVAGAARNRVDGNAISNSATGIRSGGTQTVIENNTVASASVAGVFAHGTSCVVEGNTVVGSGVGLGAGANLGCTIVRNVAKDNTTNYSIAAGNDTGPITTGALQTSPAGNISD